MINSNNRLRGMSIGQIDLHPEYSTFTVEKKYAHEVINSLTGHKFSNRKIEVSITYNNLSQVTEGFKSRNGRNKVSSRDYRRRR